jgi:hypothetical protein
MRICVLLSLFVGDIEELTAPLDATDFLIDHDSNLMLHYGTKMGDVLRVGRPYIGESSSTTTQILVSDGTPNLGRLRSYCGRVRMPASGMRTHAGRLSSS